MTIDGSFRARLLAGEFLTGFWLNPDAGAFPDPVTRVIDDERRQQFMAEGAHFESEYFLTLTYLPPIEAEERCKGWMFEGRGAYSSRKRRNRFWNGFEAGWTCSRTSSAALPDRATAAVDGSGRLRDGQHDHDRLFRYLRRCIGGHDHPFALPEIPCYLNEILACEDFHGGIEPQIGQQAHSCDRSGRIPENEFPGHSARARFTSDRVPLEHPRDSHRPGGSAWPCSTGTERSGARKIRGWKDQIFRTQSGAVNIHAQEMAADAEEAMGVAASGDVQFCQYSANIICLDDDLERLYESTRLVMKTVQNLGFSCRVEDSQCGRGVAWIAAGRRVLERSPRPAAHAESGRHAADHLRMGRASAKTRAP